MRQAVFKNELYGVFQYWRIWLILGWQDIKSRYKRSAIGPFWITISMAVTIYTMGFLYGHLFKTNLRVYFPYLAAGIVSWAFISTILIESTNIFIESENFIRNSQQYFTVFLMRLVVRNFVIYLHNLVAFLPVLFFFDEPPTWHTLLLIPGLFIVAFNGLLWGALLALLGTRFRDITQIITSVIQVIFFLTPIIWLPSLLSPRYHWAIDYNPFEQFLSLLRNPLINQPISEQSVLMVLIITLLGFFLFGCFFNKLKYRIVFWL